MLFILLCFCSISRTVGLKGALDLEGDIISDGSARVLPAVLPEPVAPTFATTSQGVYINGLLKPTSVTWDDRGHVFVSQKSGIVHRCPGWLCLAGANTVILNIFSRITSFGDHGLSRVLWDRGLDGRAYIYIVFMKNIWGLGESCRDYGQFDGRVATQIQGCQVYGAVSRWEVNDNGIIISGEQRLFDSQWPVSNDEVLGGTPSACVQFSTHSTPTDIVKMGGNSFAIALGDGAAFTGLDVGNLGMNNPCQDNAPFLGAYRCQDPSRYSEYSPFPYLYLQSLPNFSPHNSPPPHPTIHMEKP